MPKLGLTLTGLLLLVTAYSCLAKAIASETLDRRTLAETQCDSVETYTSKWFLDNTKPLFKGPLYDSALFYSRGMSSAARAVAANQGKVTIWDLWSCKLYNHENVLSNPMRCIHHDHTQRQSFFGNMSLAFAQKAYGSASVLHRNWDPPRDGIWAAIEEPELTSAGRIGWLRGFLMHPGFPGLARSLISAAELAKSEAAWLRSNVGIEWLRNLRIEDVITHQWSQIIWTRNEPARESLNRKSRKETTKREQKPLVYDDLKDEADTYCPDLGFFDDIVIW